MEQTGHRHAGRPWAGPGWGGPPWVRPGRPPAFALPVLLAFIQVVGTVGAQHNQDTRRLNVLGVLLLLAGPAALLARRRYPVTVLVAVAAVTMLYLQLRYPRGPFVLSPMVALVGAMLRGHRTAAWVIGWLTLAGHWALLVARGQPTESWPTMVAVAAVLCLVLVVGEVVRVTRERAAEIIRGRAEERRRQASDERLRIARELHDVLAHNISLINVQAGVALHLMDDDPGQARTALTAIKQASKDALRELRATLGMLRGVDEDAPRRPTAGLAGLDELARQVEAAGLRVRLEVEGERRALPGPVDLAAYRIVQEALTNVRKHAAAASATVHLGYGEAELTVRVDDDGPGSATGDGRSRHNPRKPARSAASPGSGPGGTAGSASPSGPTRSTDTAVPRRTGESSGSSGSADTAVPGRAGKFSGSSGPADTAVPGGAGGSRGPSGSTVPVDTAGAGSAAGAGGSAGSVDAAVPREAGGSGGSSGSAESVDTAMPRRAGRFSGPSGSTVPVDAAVHGGAGGSGGAAGGSGGLGGGNGIPGMRERAAALGGTLVAGPRPGGGFRVLARLPFAAAEPDGQDGAP